MSKSDALLRRQLNKNLDFLESEIEHLDQAITMVMQETDAEFAHAHSIVALELIPEVERYADVCQRIWDACTPWVGFFEALEKSAEVEKGPVPPSPTESRVSRNRGAGDVSSIPGDRMGFDESKERSYASRQPRRAYLLDDAVDEPATPDAGPRLGRVAAADSLDYSPVPPVLQYHMLNLSPAHPSHPSNRRPHTNRPAFAPETVRKIGSTPMRRHVEPATSTHDVVTHLPMVQQQRSEGSYYHHPMAAPATGHHAGLSTAKKVAFFGIPSSAHSQSHDSSHFASKYPLHQGFAGDDSDVSAPAPAASQHPETSITTPTRHPHSNHHQLFDAQTPYSQHYSDNSDDDMDPTDDSFLHRVSPPHTLPFSLPAGHRTPGKTRVERALMDASVLTGDSHSGDFDKPDTEKSFLTRDYGDRAAVQAAGQKRGFVETLRSQGGIATQQFDNTFSTGLSRPSIVSRAQGSSGMSEGHFSKRYQPPPMHSGRTPRRPRPQELEELTQAMMRNDPAFNWIDAALDQATEECHSRPEAADDDDEMGSHIEPGSAFLNTNDENVRAAMASSTPAPARLGFNAVFDASFGGVSMVVASEVGEPTAQAGTGTVLFGGGRVPTAVSAGGRHDITARNQRSIETAPSTGIPMTLDLAVFPLAFRVPPASVQIERMYAEFCKLPNQQVSIQYLRTVLPAGDYADDRICLLTDLLVRKGYLRKVTTARTEMQWILRC